MEKSVERSEETEGRREEERMGELAMAREAEGSGVIGGGRNEKAWELIEGDKRRERG